MNDEQVEQLDPASLALFEGTLGAVWGLALALVIFIQVSAFGSVLTDSLLQGMLFGLGTTWVSLVAVPLLYFAIGTVLGYAHALIFNAVMRALGRQQAATAPAQVTQDIPAASEPQPVMEPEDNEEYQEPAMPRGARPAPSFGERIPGPTERAERAERPRKRL